MVTAREFIKYFDSHPMAKVHLESKQGLQELYFIRDERHFFDELFHTYSFQLIVNDDFAHNRDLLNQWSEVQKENEMFIESLTEHANKIEILVKNNHDVSEVTYVLWHKNLMKDIEAHLVNYKKIKSGIFDVIKGFMKNQKREQKHLLDK